MRSLLVLCSLVSMALVVQAAMPLSPRERHALRLAIQEHRLTEAEAVQRFGAPERIVTVPPLLRTVPDGHGGFVTQSVTRRVYIYPGRGAWPEVQIVFVNGLADRLYTPH